MRIRSRFLLYLLTFYFFIFFVGVFAQYFSFRTFSSYLYSSISEIFNSTVGTFVNSIENIERLSVSILADEATQDFLKLDEKNKTDYSWIKKRELLAQKLSLYKFTSPYVSEIILTDSNNSPLFVNQGSYNNAFASEELKEQIRKRTIALDGGTVWSVTEGSLTPLMLSRQINEVGSFSAPPLGVLYLFIDIETMLSESFSQIKYYGLEMSIHYKKELLYTRLGQDISKIKSLLGTKHFQTITFHGKSYFATTIATEDKKWEFLILLPSSELFSKLYNINTILYGTYFFFMTLFIVLIIRFSERITRPIITLAKEMKSIDDNDFVSSASLKLPEGASIEVKQLYYEFNQMIEKIDTLVNKNLKQQLSLKQSQLQTLSGQLNPHFLYNTLDSLYWMAESNSQQEMAAAIKSLSSLLRNSLNKGEPLISLKEQLDLLNDYFYIQKIRFKDRLDYKIHVDHQLYSRQIPRFTLQPLVENSIKYSLEKVRTKCLIEVSVKEDEGAGGINILIRDNGPGIHAETAEPGNTGIGLTNLEQRIALIYDGRGALKRTENDAGGTDVLIFIPDTKEVNV